MSVSSRSATRRPFHEFIASLARGRASDEATTKLAELVEAVADTGKAGTLTFQIKVKPIKNADGRVDIIASTSISRPPAEHVAMFFVDDRYNLTRDDPSVTPLFSEAEVGGNA